MNTRVLLAAVLVALGLGGIACAKARSLSDTSGVVANACTECHGGTDNDTGAPPTDVSGRTDPSLPSVGAHTAHVQLGQGSLAKPFDCVVCHVKPTEVNSPGHIAGKVQITFGSLSTANGTLDPSYNFSTYSCSSVYCHGGFPGGNPSNAPIWNAGSSQAVCGSCHGNPTHTASALPDGHPQLVSSATNATCSICHPDTVNPDGTINVASGAHVNGTVDVLPAANHPDGWIDQSSPNFHGNAPGGISGCTTCHSYDRPAHVTTVVCNDCHNSLGISLPF
jgi:predicted CxxxxCH...CXXCH cytochrome family protein